MTSSTVSWRRTDGSGLELASVEISGEGLAITGAVVLVHEGKSWELRYRVETDAVGRTRTARVDWSAGARSGRIELAAGDDGTWRCDGEERADLQGAVDVDLGFSPSTNTLPIRRLALSDGEASSIVAAWVRFPSIDVVPLEQTYERIDARHYRYRSATGFETVIEVDAEGLVVDYPGVWMRIAAG